MPFNPRINMLVLIMLVLFIAFPLITQNQFFVHLAIMCFVFAIICESWDLTMGYLGLFNFGHLSFFSIGAYVTGMLSKFYGVSSWIGLLIGAIVASLVGFLLAIPLLRLGGKGFALFSFSFQQILFYVIRSNPGYLTGGSQGLSRIPPLTLFSIQFGGESKISSYYLALALFIVTTIFLYKVIKSNIGTALVAIKNSEEYATSRGISPFKYRLISTVLSAFFTGLVGAFYAHFLGIIGPEILGWSNIILACCIVEFGGLGTLFGPISAAFLLTTMSHYLTELEAYKNIIISLLMYFILIAFPSGLAGTTPVFRRYYQEIRDRVKVPHS